MSYVNPYLNTYGWALTVTELQNNSWVSSQLASSETITLPTDQIARNIWDPVSRRVVAWSNVQYNGQQGSIAWNIPSPSKAGDISRVNVIISNTSSNYFIVDTQIIQPNQTVSVSLPLGRNYLLRVPNVQLPTSQLLSEIEARIAAYEAAHPDLGLTAQTVARYGSRYGSRVEARNNVVNQISNQLFDVVSSTELNINPDLDSVESRNWIRRFQVFPLPDQIITITATAIAGTSEAKSKIHTVRRTIHNCYKNTMYVKQRPCAWSFAQNMAQILPNRSLTLEFYRDYQIYLQSSDGTITSGIYNTRCKSINYPLFFKADGSISYESCNGISVLDNSECQNAEIPYVSPPPETCPLPSWWSNWWWLIVLLAFVVILLIIFAVYSSKPKGMVEMYDG